MDIQKLVCSYSGIWDQNVKEALTVLLEKWSSVTNDFVPLTVRICHTCCIPKTLNLSCGGNSESMKLNLAVNGKLLSSVPLDEKLATNEYYVKAFRRLLLMRHRKDLLQGNKQANFYLEVPATKAN